MAALHAAKSGLEYQVSLTLRAQSNRKGGGKSHLQFQFPIVGHQMTICEEKTKLVTFNIKTMLFLG